MNEIRRYLDAGFSCALLPQYGDLTPTRPAFIRDVFSIAGRNLAIRMGVGFYVLRFSKRRPEFEDDIRAVNEVVGSPPQIMGKRLAQWLILSPIQIPTGEVGGIGLLSKAHIADAAVCPPSFFVMSDGTTDALRWTTDDIMPRPAGPAFYQTLRYASRITDNALAFALQELNR